jgi:hypothetical protein
MEARKRVEREIEIRQWEVSPCTRQLILYVKIDPPEDVLHGLVQTANCTTAIR